MDVLLPLTLEPSAGALVHVTAGVFDTVHAKLVEGTVDRSTISVAPPLHIVAVLFTVALASGIALILKR